MSDRPAECSTCGDGRTHTPPPPPEPKDPRWPERPCALCGVPSAPAHFFCAPHQVQVEDAMRDRLPLLQTAYETSHGAALDAFLQAGHLSQARWWLGNGMAWAEAQAADWIEILWDAYDGQAATAMDLRFLVGPPWPHAKPEDPRPWWAPGTEAARAQLNAHLQTRLAGALLEALQTLPTAPLEQELLHAYQGRRSGWVWPASDTTELHEDAADQVGDCGLPVEFRTLAALRYGTVFRTFQWHGWDAPDQDWAPVLDTFPPEIAAALRRIWAAKD